VATRCIPHVADVTDASAVAALAARLRREFGRVDILINNAGVLLEPKDFAAPQGASVFVVDPELVTATYTCNASGAAAPDSGAGAADA
jgi:NAD(P)-dependent dehydrogenase (short-subunit alcohol dehydrogenase family)